MQKKLFKIILFIFVIILSIPLLGCKTAIEKYGNYISELRDNIFLAQAENFSVKIITGRREDPFIMDGIVGEVRDFTVITVTPLLGLVQELNYSALINGETFEGALIPHPFQNTLSIDLRVFANGEDISVKLKYQAGENITETVLTAKSVRTPDMIDAHKAIEIAEKQLRYRIADFRVDGNFEAEIFVRLLQNPIDNSGGFYWYVAFIARTGEIVATLINPISMEVVAVRD